MRNGLVPNPSNMELGLFSPIRISSRVNLEAEVRLGHAQMRLSNPRYGEKRVIWLA